MPPPWPDQRRRRSALPSAPRPVSSAAPTQAHRLTHAAQCCPPLPTTQVTEIVAVAPEAVDQVIASSCRRPSTRRSKRRSIATAASSRRRSQRRRSRRFSRRGAPRDRASSTTSRTPTTRRSMSRSATASSPAPPLSAAATHATVAPPRGDGGADGGVDDENEWIYPLPPSEGYVEAGAKSSRWSRRCGITMMVKHKQLQRPRRFLQAQG